MRACVRVRIPQDILRLQPTVPTQSPRRSGSDTREHIAHSSSPARGRFIVLLAEGVPLVTSSSPPASKLLSLAALARFLRWYSLSLIFFCCAAVISVGMRMGGGRTMLVGLVPGV